MPRRLPSRSRESGSAYLVALFVLVVLTLLGMSLSLITVTESQIGANERSIQRVFFAGELGVQLATAKALTIPDTRAMLLDFNEPSGGAVTIVNRLDVSGMVPIQASPCNLCQINQNAEFFKINHAVTSRSSRLGWSPGLDPDSDDPTVLAAAVVGMMIDVQPLGPTAESIAAHDSAALKKISF